MFLGKNIFDELIKSTLITLSLFSLFDMIMQGYHFYHSIVIGTIILSFISYTFYKHMINL